MERLNYSTHAIEDMRQRRETFSSGAYVAQVLNTLANMLEESVKFTLPNCADLIHHADLRQTHLDLVR